MAVATGVVSLFFMALMAIVGLNYSRSGPISRELGPEPSPQGRLRMDSERLREPLHSLGTSPALGKVTRQNADPEDVPK